MNEWKSYTLKDLSKGKGEYGIGASAIPFDKDKLTYLRITDINDDGTLNKSGLTSVDAVDASKYLLDNNDIVFARTGNSTGRSYFYDGSDGPLVYAGFLIRFRLDDSKVNPRILKYYTHSKPYYDWVQSFDTGGTRGNINAKTYGDMPITLPPRHVQDRIVDILYSLDAKIENNRHINDNLEQQAQAAFNNIIVQYSECETINLSEIAVMNPKRAIAKGTLARSIEMAQLPTSGSFPAGWDMKEYNGGMKFQNGDTLMARITPCLENGKVAYINFLEENEVAFGSTEYIVIASKGAIAPEVFYFLTRYNDFVDFAVKNMNGSSGRQRVSAETIGTYKLPIISPEDMVILETIAREALNKIKYNSLENIRLSEIRDTLLPKLMSGELEINEIDC